MFIQYVIHILTYKKYEVGEGLECVQIKMVIIFKYASDTLKGWLMMGFNSFMHFPVEIYFNILSDFCRL